MTARYPLKCDVCGTETVLRIQIGHLEHQPLRVPCGNCGILFVGTLTTDPAKGSWAVNFQNASQVPEQDPKFYLGVAAEFISDRLQRVENGQIPIPFSAFMEAFGQMGPGGYEDFMSRRSGFLSNSKSMWPQTRRLNELWIRGQDEYLYQAGCRKIRCGWGGSSFFTRFCQSGSAPQVFGPIPQRAGRPAGRGLLAR